ncbi:MAG: YXWGXW repeat-containing protein [Rhodospirillales bacterium]|nr:YXWGXW repeat-containing protein [Rhodospirillales bacterium]
MTPTRLAATMILLATLAGCGGDAGTGNPYPPVPPPRPEAVAKPPVTAVPLFWQPGHWNWTGAGYAWAPGRYVPQNGHSNLYMPGYWRHGIGGWDWVPAHWQ